MRRPKLCLSRTAWQQSAAEQPVLQASLLEYTLLGEISNLAPLECVLKLCNATRCGSEFFIYIYIYIYIFFPPVPSPGQQAVGVPAQRKGNPPDHRRRERQEAGGQTGQQLNWSDAQARTCSSNKLLLTKGAALCHHSGRPLMATRVFFFTVTLRVQLNSEQISASACFHLISDFLSHRPSVLLVILETNFAAPVFSLPHSSSHLSCLPLLPPSPPSPVFTTSSSHPSSDSSPAPYGSCWDAACSALQKPGPALAGAVCVRVDVLDVPGCL